MLRAGVNGEAGPRPPRAHPNSGLESSGLVYWASGKPVHPMLPATLRYRMVTCANARNCD